MYREPSKLMHPTQQGKLIFHIRRWHFLSRNRTLDTIAQPQILTHEFNSLPSMPPGNLIGSPSSRRNVMDGGGDPVAEHLNVTLLPSLTTISVLNIHQNDKAHSFTN